MNAGTMQGFEIGFFKRKSGVSEDALLLANKQMEENFLKNEKNLFTHKLIKINENLYADIAITKTKEDAKIICSKWTEDKYALSFLSLIEVIKLEGLEMLTFADILISSEFQSHETDHAVEIVSFEFAKETDLNEQKEMMSELNQIVKTLDGFKSRNYYYSSENGRWIDFVIWRDLGLAERASEKMMNTPRAKLAFSKIDEKSMIFSHYNWVGGEKKT